MPAGTQLTPQQKKCSSCKYGSVTYFTSKLVICNYLLDTGKMRGCDVENCDKYVKGKRPRQRCFEYH